MLRLFSFQAASQQNRDAQNIFFLSAPCNTFLKCWQVGEENICKNIYHVKRNSD